MSDVVLLVPRRRDHGHRDRLWGFSRAVWADLFPDWPIVEGHHNTGPFNRSAAINRASDAAGPWQVAVVIDSDVLPDPDGIHEAVKVARDGRFASGFSTRKNLTKAGTTKIMGGYRGSWEPLVDDEHPLCVSGALAIGRDLWDATSGFDELFVGWGFEDTAFEIAAETLSGHHVHKAPPALWHLWHAKSPEHNHRLDGFRRNRTRRDAYIAARGNPDAVRALLDEAAAAAAGHRALLPPPTTRPVTIPRILHRTVPEQTTAEVEGWWRDAGELLPGWELRTYREPIDPAEWPETGHLWAACRSGAQRAGLIRLEALWHHGGVYLDSDVELYRTLEPLLTLEGFAAWEDARCAPDAVLGFRPGHPALAIMLDLARQELERGGGAWDTGPGVSTTVLPGRHDVLLLPPGSFYPYHYKRKTQDRHRDHATEQPWAFGAHHWHHSWAGR